MVLVIVVVCVLAGVPGLAGVVGTARAAERIDVSAGGVPIHPVGSFGSPAADGSSLDPFRSSADGDRVVSAVLADLEDYWSAQISAAGGPGLAPLTGGFWSLDSLGSADGDSSGGSSAPSDDAGALCITQPRQIAGNAFYCPGQDGIVFDSAALVPVLLGSYGSAGLATSFAHEFGHAVQAQVGPTPADRRADPDRYPAILIEAQADCAAGAFLAEASAGEAFRVHIPPSSLVRAVAPVLDFRDRPTVSPSDASAHGLALDRLDSLIRGFRDGGMSCWSMTTDDLSLTLGRSGMAPGAPSQPRFSSTADAVDAASASVGSFAGVPPAGPDPADLDRAGPIGQFAEGAAVALATGRSVYGSAVGAACFTGAWVGSVFGSVPAGELGSWPGDADEGLDLIRSRPGAGFDELVAYSDGFHGGRAACG